MVQAPMAKTELPHGKNEHSRGSYTTCLEEGHIHPYSFQRAGGYTTLAFSVLMTVLYVSGEKAAAY